jgi:hypothetical protein
VMRTYAQPRHCTCPFPRRLTPDAVFMSQHTVGLAPRHNWGLNARQGVAHMRSRCARRAMREEGREGRTPCRTRGRGECGGRRGQAAAWVVRRRTWPPPLHRRRPPPSSVVSMPDRRQRHDNAPTRSRLSHSIDSGVDDAPKGEAHPPAAHSSGLRGDGRGNAEVAKRTPPAATNSSNDGAPSSGHHAASAVRSSARYCRKPGGPYTSSSRGMGGAMPSLCCATAVFARGCDGSGSSAGCGASVDEGCVCVP